MRKTIKIFVGLVGIVSFVDAGEYSPRQIFDNGFESALDVIEYSNEILKKGEIDTEGKYCVSLSLTESKKGEVFTVFKLFSLSLKLGMKPLYLSEMKGSSVPRFCMTLVNDYAEGLSEIKETRERYAKIDSYNARVVPLNNKDGYTPVFPFLELSRFPSAGGTHVIKRGTTAKKETTKRKEEAVRHDSNSESALPDNSDITKDIVQSTVSKRVYMIKKHK